MNKREENQLYLKTATCFDTLRLAIETFEGFLREASPASSPSYYKARNYLRDAEKFHQEVFKEAKRLLGPMPVYASADFEKWRQDFLSQHQILAASQEREAVKEELLADGRLSQWMSGADIERLLSKNFEAQKTGKRKLANIKVRIILDKLTELLAEAQELSKKAMEKFQAGA
jgi:hypothetical protein